METSNNFENVKVGDEVVFETWGGFGPARYYVEKVKSITPKGFIKVRDALFNKNGSARGDWSYRILPVTEETLGFVKDTQEMILIYGIKRKLREASLENLTYEQAMKISEIMGWN